MSALKTLIDRFQIHADWVCLLPTECGWQIVHSDNSSHVLHEAEELEDVLRAYLEERCEQSRLHFDSEEERRAFFLGI